MAPNNLDILQLPPLASLISSGLVTDSRHQPLNKHRDQIRILRLSRGFWNDPICCNTFRAYLEDKPAYVALSYVWGNPLVSRPITLNGGQVLVTSNLFAALMRLRNHHRDINLWVDVLCINQIDGNEKAHQISLMRKIYSTATEGIMWLGDYVEGSLLSLSEPLPSVVHPTSQIIPQASAIEAFSFIERLAKDAHLEVDEVDAITPNLPGAPDGVSSLAMLMSLAWWERIWTVQEVVLPQKVRFQCGKLLLPLDRFDKAVENYTRHRDSSCCQKEDERDYVLDDLSIRIDTIITMRENRNKLENFVTALFMFRTRVASDKRDKIYALLGLLSTGFVPLSVDYSLTNVEVCRNVLVDLVRLSGDLLPLLMAGETGRDPCLPSWVPDWCVEVPEHQQRMGCSDIVNYKKYKAANGQRAVIGDASCTALSLSGHSVDTIVCTIPCEYNAIAVEEFFSLLASFQMFSFVRPSSAYPGVGTYMEAFSSATSVYYISSDSVYFATRKGLLGVTNNEVATGDEVYILLGGNLPFILRPSSENRFSNLAYTYIGHCYTHGIMYGEALEADATRQWVCLV